MNLTAVSVAALSRWPCHASLAADLRQQLTGKVVLLPPELPEVERGDIVDLLTLFLELPVHPSARAEGAPAKHLVILTEPVDAEPAGVGGSVLLGVRRRQPGRRRMDETRDLRIFRNVIVECLGRRYSGTRLQRVAAWAGQVSDGPTLALRFASGAMAEHFANPEGSDAAMYAVGLASTVGSLMRGLDLRVAQWVLARALPAKHPGRLVDTEALVLGEDAALQRAFAAGLIEGLPEEEGDVLDLRQPLHLLGHAEDRPVEVTDAVMAEALRAELAPELYVVVDRLLRSAPKPLGLTGTPQPRDFVGRRDVLKRLESLFEPADMVPTTVLYGIEGSGRTAVAAALCEQLGPAIEPVWVTFAGGPEGGWMPVANALGMDLNEIPRGVAGSRVPAWVGKVHERLRERPCLVVVTDVDEVTEDALPGWLPSGQGECAVLVLSRSAQRRLQRDHDAIAVPLRALSPEEAKDLLAGKVPKLAGAIAAGEADELLRTIDGHPGAIGMAATLLEKTGLAEVEVLATHRDGPIRTLVDKAVAALDPEELRLACALAVCAPAGSPQALPVRTAEVGDVVMGRLLDRAVVVTTPRRIRLHGLVRLAMERKLGEEERTNLEVAHAWHAAALIEGSQEAGDSLGEDDAYEDALLGLERMTLSCQSGANGVAALTARLADSLVHYPRGDHDKRIRLAIAGYRAALAAYTEEVAPETWSHLQSRLGVALWSLPTGNRSENLSKAITAFRDALRIRTQKSHPYSWAATQNNLGNALSEPPLGNTRESLQQAIDAYQSALTIWTKESYPENWAMAQNNLGTVFMALPTGDKSKNLHQAIEAYQAALTVWSQDKHRHDWGMAQHNLGSALSTLSSGDQAKNQRQAIEAYRAALTVYTKDEFPADWAMSQRDLGLTLRELVSGDRKRNLRDAVDALRAALSVYTPEAFPHEHPSAQAGLDAALRDLAALEAPEPSPPKPAKPRPSRRRTKP